MQGQIPGQTLERGVENVQENGQSEVWMQPPAASPTDPVNRSHRALKPSALHAAHCGHLHVFAAALVGRYSSHPSLLSAL